MKYKVGDIIRIKSSSKLKELKEYNKRYNSIELSLQFTHKMWHLCDKQYKILEIYIKEYYIIKDKFNEEWMIADWMIGENNIDNKGNFLLEL